MASVAYSRTDQYVFIAQKRNSGVFSLLGKNTEYSFSYRLVRDMNMMKFVSKFDTSCLTQTSH